MLAWSSCCYLASVHHNNRSTNGRRPIGRTPCWQAAGWILRGIEPTQPPDLSRQSSSSAPEGTRSHRRAEGTSGFGDVHVQEVICIIFMLVCPNTFEPLNMKVHKMSYFCETSELWSHHDCFHCCAAQTKVFCPNTCGPDCIRNDVLHHQNLS